MLHDPSHYAPPAEAEPIVLSAADREVLRALLAEIAVVAALPVHREKARLWQKLNDLDAVRPMVWINEICWNEMNVDDELTLRCEHRWARDQEREWRRLLYQWRHLPADMVVSDHVACPLAIHSTDFGIIEDVDLRWTDEDNDIVSRRFRIQIREPDDLEKIRMPIVTHDEAATGFCHQALTELCEGILPVRKVGQTHIWFTPWDYLIRWWGIENAMIDMIDRPDLVHAGVERLVQAWMVELDQFVEQDLLDLDCDNTRVGSGGYGYTDALPGGEYDADRVQPRNMWGCSNAQIFSDVSPRMHWEFAIEHDLKWLARWGMTYYGCCEPLDGKMDLLRRIPNLRKVSVTPWCDTKRAIAEIGDDYVISRKPSPSVFAGDVWDPDQARQQLRDFLEPTEGKCHVELIMKDISTVRHEPQRLWEWAAIAMEEAERFAR